jgi:type I restriction-modification system DNA methylase subunit
MPISAKILDLVNNFREHEEEYKRGNYNETEVRRQFVDEFFTELGWDVRNKQSHAEAYKEVVHEDKVKVINKTKAPDYSFRVGGIRKFFVEAKKPSVKIHSERDPAFQLRRYGWSAGLPLSILTDFEEFAIYDCRVKPKPNDKASTARIFYCRYTDYEKRWDEISDIFSKEAILRGAFDKFVASDKKKRGTATVDVDFLKAIENWRDVLARNLALRNNLNQRELNFAVAKIIDRLIFLRITEDRGIENFGQLKKAAGGNNAYSSLLKIFQTADNRYNSGLFHFQTEKNMNDPPDTLTPKLKIDDKILKEIVSELYYPKSSYEFSVMPADILGKVYEQFLGKVIRLTSEHRAVVEEKPEVKKAGGVYYTPKYIVDYIVQQTVGKLCEKAKTPAKIAKLKIVDPACGSGSFLLGAYQFLIDWHREYFARNPKKFKKEIYQSGNGEYRLTTAKKKEILLNNIFGVDIDGQAVEVTKLSLLLKVLENESDETLQQQFPLFRRERVLPSLANNIKCGNSLIGSDFSAQQSLNLFGEDERLRINAFDWESGFAEIFSSGGFDAVIGNPPWITLRGKEFMGVSNSELNYYLNKYTNSAEYKVNSFALFIEKGIDLLKKGGIFGNIVPSTLLSNQYLAKIRKYILEQSKFQVLAELGKNIFENAIADVCIILLLKENSSKNKVQVLSNVKNLPEGDYKIQNINQKLYRDNKDFIFETRINDVDRKIIQHIESKSVSLVEFVKNYVGIVTGDNKTFISETPETNKHKKILIGRNIGRYFCGQPKKYVLFDPDKLHSNTDEKIYRQKEKILIRKTGNILFATIDRNQYFTDQTIYNLVPKNDSANIDLIFLLGLINSRLIQFYFSRKLITNPDAFPYIKGIHINVLPICKNPEKSQHNKLVKLVNQMLDLNKKLQTATLPQDQEMTQRQITATDREIDNLVFDLYRLSEEERRVILGN